MRERVKSVMILTLILAMTLEAEAFLGKKKKEEKIPESSETTSVSTPSSTATTPATPTTSTLSLAERKEAEEKAKQKLSTKEWVIYLMPMGGKSTKTKTDILTFTDGKFNSQNLSQRGYPTSNITLTIQENGVIIWETMQTTEAGDVAFWRGELEGEVMRGVVSIHPLKAENEDYSFTTNPPPSMTTEEKATTGGSTSEETPKKKR